MRSTITFIAGFILTAIAIVGAIAFVRWGFDPIAWEPVDRFFFLFLGGLVSVVGGLFASNTWGH